jgi:hypothetical protein
MQSKQTFFIRSSRTVVEVSWVQDLWKTDHVKIKLIHFSPFDLYHISPFVLIINYCPS